MRYRPIGNIYNIYNKNYAQKDEFYDLDLEGQGAKSNNFYCIPEIYN